MCKYQKYWVFKYVLFVAVALMVGAASHRAEASQATYVKPCLTNAGNSPASSYCSGLTYIRIENSDQATTYSSTIGHCIASGTCSITANVGTTSTTWSVSAGSSTTYFDGTPADMATMDICFALNSDSTAYTATLKLGCATGETTASTATSDGLPALSTPAASGS